MKPSYAQGFSLIEMAMVLMIIGLLLAGLLAPLSGQIEAAKITETRRIQDTVRESLFGYAMTHGRIPCPAQATLPTTDISAGKAAFDGTECTCKGPGSDAKIAWVSGVVCSDSAGAVQGVLPWAELGVDETDAWGRRFTYRVNREFADTPSGAQATFTLADTGNLKIQTGGTTVTVPVVIVSHGKNGFGAYTNNGIQLNLGSGDEAENYDNNNVFVSHDHTTEFDDLVIWISPNILKNRMVTAGMLP